MFLTLNQALKESPVGMAIVEFPYKDVVKLCADGSTKIIMNRSDGSTSLIKAGPEDLDRTNRILVLKGINCRPVYE